MSERARKRETMKGAHAPCKATATPRCSFLHKEVGRVYVSETVVVLLRTGR